MSGISGETAGPLADGGGSDEDDGGPLLVLGGMPVCGIDGMLVALPNIAWFARVSAGRCFVVEGSRLQAAVQGQQAVSEYDRRSLTAHVATCAIARNAAYGGSRRPASTTSCSPRSTPRRRPAMPLALVVPLPAANIPVVLGAATLVAEAARSWSLDVTATVVSRRLSQRASYDQLYIGRDRLGDVIPRARLSLEGRLETFGAARCAPRGRMVFTSDPARAAGSHGAFVVDGTGASKII